MDKRWSKEEIKFLQDNYLLLSNKELCNKLHRNINSVRSKINKLKLTRPDKYRVGDTYYELTITKLYKINGKCGYIIVADYKCSCGGEKLKIEPILVKTGRIKSCGHLTKDHGKRITKHGLTNHKLRTVWRGMHRRCKNQKDKWYHRYGGRGITICKEWESLVGFYNWSIENGYKNGLQIDRIDNNGNYEPSNCRWVTPKENSNNKTTNHYLTIFNEIKTIAQWVEDPRCRVEEDVLRYRIRRGWEPEKAITTPKNGV